jgi:2-polyprenyl-6-methoxyphenol hydroxylase-like FAD-dependent oxidoreductase
MEFKNGSVAFADLVVAADGANSKVRPYITPVKPYYSGITVIEGAVYDSAINSPKIHRLLNGGKIFAMGDSKLLVVSAKGDGSLVFYTSCKTVENWIHQSGIDFSYKQQVFDWFRAEYAGWDDTFTELFENASISFFCRPLYCMPVDQTWKPLPNLTMIGDAAHLMPPFAGEGVNMAMLDALELGRHLTRDDHADLQSAIAAFEQQMRVRASATTADTLEATEALHGPDAIAFMTAVIGQSDV